MTTEDHTFNSHMHEWQAWQQTPWGRLRYSIAMANLQRHLATESLRILDIGGGDGSESILLAQHGHKVTLIDYASDMLALAQHAITAQNVSVQLIQGSLEELEQHIEQHSFDLVLCHNVIQYMAEPQVLLEQIANVTKPHGLLSLICINPASEVLVQALQHENPSAAIERLAATTIQANMFGVEVQRLPADTLTRMLQNADYSTIQQYGIRCICDYMPNNEQKTEASFFAQLEALEIAISGIAPYNTIGRFNQLIATVSTAF